MILAVGLCLSASGCMFQKANINNHEERLLSYDRADVTNTQDAYRASVVQNGAYSARTVQAMTDVNQAQHKLSTDQRDFRDYLSASGQTTEPEP